MMQSAAGAVISNGKWKISFFSQVLADPNDSDDSAENCRMDPVPVLVRVPDSG